MVHLVLLLYMVENCCCAHLSLHEDPFIWRVAPHFARPPVNADADLVYFASCARSSRDWPAVQIWGEAPIEHNAIVRRLCDFAASSRISPPLCLPSDCNMCLKSLSKSGLYNWIFPSCVTFIVVKCRPVIYCWQDLRILLLLLIWSDCAVAIMMSISRCN